MVSAVAEISGGMIGETHAAFQHCDGEKPAWSINQAALRMKAAKNADAGNPAQPGGSHPGAIITPRNS